MVPLVLAKVEDPGAHHEDGDEHADPDERGDIGHSGSPPIRS